VKAPVRREEKLFSLNRAELFRIVAVMAPAAFLRFYRIGQQSYWADEVQSIWQVNGHAGTIFNNIITNFHGPLHFTLLLGWGELGGWSEAWTRSLSALAGLACIWLFYLLARKIAGRTAAIWAIILMAVSPFHVWYSQEVRNYVFLHLFVILSMLLFLRILEREDSETISFRRRTGEWAVFLAASAAALLCNLAALFLFAVQGIFTLIIKPKLALKLSVLLAVLFLILLPWIAGIELGWNLEHIMHGDPLRKINFHPLGVPYTYLVFSLGETFAPSSDQMHRALSFGMFKPFLPYLALAFVTYSILLFQGLRAWARERNRLILFSLWLVVPLVFVSILAILNLKVFQPRYASVSFPAYLIVIAAGMARSGRKLRWLLAASIALLTLVSLHNHYTDPRYWKPDVRAAVRPVNSRSRPGDVLLIYTIQEPVRFYYNGPAEIRSVYPLPGTGGFDEKVSELRESFDRIWLVDNYGWYIDPEDRIPEGYREEFMLDKKYSYNKVRVWLFRMGAEQ